MNAGLATEVNISSLRCKTYPQEPQWLYARSLEIGKFADSVCIYTNEVKLTCYIIFHLINININNAWRMSLVSKTSLHICLLHTFILLAWVQSFLLVLRCILAASLFFIARSTVSWIDCRVLASYCWCGCENIIFVPFSFSKYVSNIHGEFIIMYVMQSTCSEDSVFFSLCCTHANCCLLWQVLNLCSL